MITNHGHKTIPVSKIKAPGDIAAIRREAHTAELGETLGATGGTWADPIFVEWGTWKLLPGGGRHRLAAALNKRLKEIDVVLVEGTPEELELFTLTEQVKRRGATDAEIARMIALLHPKPEDTFPDVPDEDFEEEPTLAPKQTKKEAIAKVAKLTGRTEAAVKQADYRARVEEEPKKEPEPAEPAACPIETMGLTVPVDVLKSAQDESDFLTGILRTLVRQQADCSRNGLASMAEAYKELKRGLHDAAAMVRSMLPDHVCIYCKLTSRRAGCVVCRGRGWLTKAEMANAPKDLMVTGASAGIFVDGKWKLLKEVK